LPYSVCFGLWAIFHRLSVLGYGAQTLHLTMIKDKIMPKNRSERGKKKKERKMKGLIPLVQTF
jgi:hypothetical protein